MTICKMPSAANPMAGANLAQFVAKHASADVPQMPHRSEWTAGYNAAIVAAAAHLKRKADQNEGALGVLLEMYAKEILVKMKEQG